MTPMEDSNREAVELVLHLRETALDIEEALSRLFDAIEKAEEVAADGASLSEMLEECGNVLLDEIGPDWLRDTGVLLAVHQAIEGGTLAVKD